MRDMGICSTTLFQTRKYIYISKDFIYRLRERERERAEGNKKERERNINVGEIHLLAASYMPPKGDPAHNPGMCPDWESNKRPFGLQVRAH